jgi:hypothetical protein
METGSGSDGTEMTFGRGTGRLLARILLPLVLAIAGCADARAGEPIASCPDTGPGFMKLRGTTSCISLGGDATISIRSEHARKSLAIETLRIGDIPAVAYRKVKPTSVYSNLFQIRAGLTLIHVTPTDYGPLVSSLSASTGSVVRAADRADIDSSDMRINRATVQWNGWTFGYAPSTFDFSGGYSYSEGYSSSATLNQLAYQHAISKNLSVGLSMESAGDRRIFDGVWSLDTNRGRPDIVVSAQYATKNFRAHAAAAAAQARDIALCCGRFDGTVGTAAIVGVEQRLNYAELFKNQIGQMFGKVMASAAVADGAVGYLGMPAFATDFIKGADGRVRHTQGATGIVSYEHIWGPTVKTTMSFSVFGSRTKMPELDWRTFGTLTQLGLEAMPSRGLTIGMELNLYRDSVGNRRDPTGTLSAPLTTSFIYLRKRM